MKRIHRRWLRLLVVLVAFILVVLWYTLFFQKGEQTPQATAAPVIPVVAAAVTKGNLPIYLTGLGTVTPLNTVTVRTRVEGQLLNVYTVEGQIVHPGDLLAEIDPSPSQVKLEQAQGQMERDQAVLANAKLDLERYKTLYAQDSVPKQQLDTQVALVAQAEAALKTDQGA